MASTIPEVSDGDPCLLPLVQKECCPYEAFQLVGGDFPLWHLLLAGLPLSIEEVSNLSGNSFWASKGRPHWVRYQAVVSDGLC